MKNAIGPKAQPQPRTWVLDAIYVSVLTSLTQGFIVWF